MMPRGENTALTIGWEMAVIGTALADPTAMEQATDLLPSDFTGCHGEIWAEMLYLHRNSALELRALVEALRTRNRLDSVGSLDGQFTGEQYIAELVTRRGEAMQEYADRVLGASLKRQLLQSAALISAEAMDIRVPAEEAMDNAERRLMTLRRNRLGNMGVSMEDLMSIFGSRLAGFLNGTIEPAWIPKTSAIKKLIGYMEKDDFAVVAARPGEGKSSWMRYEFLESAMNGVPTTMFNLENGMIEYARYAVSYVTGIDSFLLRDPRLLNEDQLETISAAIDRLRSIPFYVVTLGAPSALDIERIVRQHISRYGTRLIGVDYLQLVKNAGKDRKIDDVSETSNLLRAIPLRFGVPLIAASQMSRSIIHRGDDAEPELSDLRESGAIEQDATIVIFPRPLWNNPTRAQLGMFPQNVNPVTNEVFTNPNAIPVRAFVRKNRNGPVGVTDPYLWVKPTNNFMALTRPEGWESE